MFQSLRMQHTLVNKLNCCRDHGWYSTKQGWQHPYCDTQSTYNSKGKDDSCKDQITQLLEPDLGPTTWHDVSEEPKEEVKKLHPLSVGGGGRGVGV